MKYDFNKPTERRSTGSYKWDIAPDSDIIPLWVADMDFEAAPAIQNAIKKRVEHGVYGYVKVPEEYYEASIRWFASRHNWHFKREWMTYTIGVVPAISAIIKAFTQPGDKVIVQPKPRAFPSADLRIGHVASTGNSRLTALPMRIRGGLFPPLRRRPKMGDRRLHFTA